MLVITVVGIVHASKLETTVSRLTFVFLVVRITTLVEEFVKVLLRLTWKFQSTHLSMTAPL